MSRQCPMSSSQRHSLIGPIPLRAAPSRSPLQSGSPGPISWTGIGPPCQGSGSVAGDSGPAYTLASAGTREPRPPKSRLALDFHFPPLIWFAL
jgi:hypothetical protein